MKSKFKIVSYFIVIFFLMTFGLFASLIISQEGFTSLTAVVIVGFFMFLVVLIFFFELRNKVISIEVNEKNIIIKRYAGIGKTVCIDKNVIDGFHASIVSTKYGDYNYLYLMNGNEKIAKISNQYHKNFDQLSVEIRKKYKDLGYVKSGFFSEFRDIIN